MNKKIEEIIQETKDLLNDKRNEETLLKAYVVLANNTEEIIAEIEGLERKVEISELEFAVRDKETTGLVNQITKLQRVCDNIQAIVDGIPETKKQLTLMGKTDEVGLLTSFEGDLHHALKESK